MMSMLEVWVQHEESFTIYSFLNIELNLCLLKMEVHQNVGVGGRLSLYKEDLSRVYARFLLFFFGVRNTRA